MVTNVRFDSAFSAPETIELESSGEVRTQSLILNGKGSYLLEHPLPDDFLLKRDIWQQTPFLEIFFSTMAFSATSFISSRCHFPHGYR